MRYWQHDETGRVIATGDAVIFETSRYCEISKEDVREFAR